MKVHCATVLVTAVLATSGLLLSQPATTDIFGGLDKERKAAFYAWQRDLDAFNKAFFPLNNSSAIPPYCSPSFPDALKRLKTAYDSSFQKQREYFRRWLDDVNDSIKSRQVVLARIKEQYDRVQSTLRLKEQEIGRAHV